MTDNRATSAQVFITGATGFVGAAVAKNLLAAGYKVRALVRPQSNLENLEDLDVDRVTGDLSDVEVLTRAMLGCEAVFHVAADYRLWTRDPRELYTSNVDGTKNIMEAALAAGVTRIVYTSSVATLAIGSDGHVSSEDSLGALGEMIGHYKRSKYLAERLVVEMVRERGLPAVIVSPSTPIGPGDVKPTPTGKIIRDAIAGKLPAYVNTGLNLVHVDDVAEGHMLALRKGVVGQNYILGGEDMSLKDILVEVASITGGKPPRVRIPYVLAYSVASIAELFAYVTNSDEPLATRDGVRMSRKIMYFSSDKARRELGYTSRPALTALHDAVNWFVERKTGQGASQ
jgi:dihydroflavonol-4-reductase